MLYFDSIDVSEGVDVNKSSASKECDTSHYCYFLNKSFKFQPNICNRCHDLLMMSINFSYIPISNIKGSNYWCIINGISKSGEIKLLQNFTEKGVKHYKTKYQKQFWSCKFMPNSNLHEKSGKL